jgi:PIN domain nuclease of toxin-antitoxin system
MKLLLDTCTFLWIVGDKSELSDTARALFVDSANEVYLSAISSWEIGVKYRLGRLQLDRPPNEYVPDQRKKHCITSLPLEEPATLQMDKLPAHHRDPFDRMLICQALHHGMALLTPDQEIRRYPVRTEW